MQNRHLLIIAAVVLSFFALLLGSILFFLPMEIESPPSTTETIPVEEEIVEIDLEEEIETPLAIQQEFLDVRAIGMSRLGAWIQNPTTGDRQSVRIYLPEEAGPFPAVVLVPGGSGDGNAFEPGSTPDGRDALAVRLVNEGMIAVVYSPLGTGESEGDVDYQGFADQDGLASILWATSQLPQVDPTNIGLASFSYGVTGAAGTLARYPELAVKYWSDWEGPTSRYYTTVGCPQNRNLDAVTPAKFPCNDDDHWAEREAVEFAKYLSVDYYWRIQETKDHVQSTYGHTIEILDAALANDDMPWVKVNDAEVNTSFTEATLPTGDYLDKYTEAAIPHILEMSQM